MATLIWSLSFSPDGEMLVGGFDHGAIRVWDTRSGKELHTLKPTTHYPGPHRIAFSPDGKSLAFQIQTSVVQRLDLATGRLRELRTGHNNGAIRLAYSPDGQTLATGADDRRIKLWNTGTDQETANLSGHQGAVTCLAFSPDGKTLASGDGSGELKLWDVTTAQELFSLDGHTAVITIAFSPDGKTLASTGATRDGLGEIRFWRTATTEVKHDAGVEIRPQGSARRQNGLFPRDVGTLPAGHPESPISIMNLLSTRTQRGLTTDHFRKMETSISKKLDRVFNQTSHLIIAALCGYATCTPPEPGSDGVQGRRVCEPGQGIR